MKIRMIALAGVAALAIAGPAAASNATGWYIGLGLGWDRLGNVKGSLVPTGTGYTGGTAKLGTDDGVLVTGAFGYRFANRVRLEAEFGYTPHSIKETGYSGHVDITSAMLNAAYDFPLTDKWDFTLGGGVGVGSADAEAKGPVYTYLTGTHNGLMYQLMAGF
ncbi:MAG: outer membrane beta-barrel protein, partial [Alphaproteobacteria bacterium]|nr:outer membrane beta-barrel protein [Alphaproteobacteria bacterium]